VPPRPERVELRDGQVAAQDRAAAVRGQRVSSAPAAPEGHSVREGSRARPSLGAAAPARGAAQGLRERGPRAAAAPWVEAPREEALVARAARAEARAAPAGRCR